MGDHLHLDGGDMVRRLCVCELPFFFLLLILELPLEFIQIEFVSNVFGPFIMTELKKNSGVVKRPPSLFLFHLLFLLLRSGIIYRFRRGLIFLCVFDF